MHRHYCINISIFCDILLLHYIIIILRYFAFNLRSSKNLCLCSRGINLSLSISLKIVSELLCDEFFETLVILSAVIFPTKSPVASAAFF